MVEAEVPERSEGLAVGDDGAECASEGAADAVILNNIMVSLICSCET